MNDDDLCYMQATEVLARFRARTLSPVELTEAVIRRAEAIGETVNPFADRYFGEAMERARAAETKYARTGSRPRRLEGLPLAVKDASEIRGRRTTNGSLINKDRIGQSTNPAIERLLRSGDGGGIVALFAPNCADYRPNRRTEPQNPAHKTASVAQIPKTGKPIIQTRRPVTWKKQQAFSHILDPKGTFRLQSGSRKTKFRMNRSCVPSGNVP